MGREAAQPPVVPAGLEPPETAEPLFCSDQAAHPLVGRWGAGCTSGAPSSPTKARAARSNLLLPQRLPAFTRPLDDGWVPVLGHRRPWSDEDKSRVVAESYVPGAVVAEKGATARHSTAASVRVAQGGAGARKESSPLKG
jgi:hypothetical protein